MIPRQNTKAMRIKKGAIALIGLRRCFIRALSA